MSVSFSFAMPPFDRLTPDQRERLRASLDIGFFPKDRAIFCGEVNAGETLCVLYKGQVEERRGGDRLAYYGPLDSFDARSLFGTQEPNTFLAVEDTICHLIPKRVIMELAAENPPFGNFFVVDISQRLRSLASDQSHRELAAMAMVPLHRAVIRPPVFVEWKATLSEVAQAMKDQGATAVLVRAGKRTGIVTGTDLREATLIEGMAPTAPVGPLAHYDLVALDRDDPLFEALTQMIERSIRRVVVRERDQIIGIVEQIDLLGYLSNHSQIITLRIDRARTPEELARASADQFNLVRTLHATGVKVQFLADMVTELNRKLFRRLFEMLAPSDLVANSCLIVMGSEGRGEQILKTDQDNGLILRDGYTNPELERVVHEFTHYLEDFGYPPCPGNIMVSNPIWTQSVSDFRKMIYGWMVRPDETAPLNLAIFWDSAPVSGDPTLLADLRAYLLSRLADNDAFFGHFARPALGFEEPGGLLAALIGGGGNRNLVDIKKAAIFPLVHGIRSLGLEQRITRSSTLDRLWALCDTGVIERPFATALADCYLVLQELRLNAQLANRAGEQEDANIVRMELLSKLERDQFKDCLDVVKRFKQFISHHFHLEIF